LINNLSGQTLWLIDNNGCKVHNPYPRKGESVLWTGDCIDSLASGEGQLIWFLYGFKTKNIFIGTMMNGKPYSGKYTFSRGPILQGEFKNGDFFKGTQTDKIGKYTYVYKGEFVNYLISGKGELEVIDSYRYIGEFEDGFKNGNGKQYYENGDIFEGAFKDDYYKTGKLFVKEYGFTIESDNWKYNSALNGTITYEDSTIYKGDIAFSMPHGKGVMTYTSGDNYNGNWRRNIQHGAGTYIFNNGLIYKATWKNGKLHGTGQIIYPNGKVSIATWKYGELFEEVISN